MPTIDDILESFKHKKARLEYARAVYEKACSQPEVIRKRDGVLVKTKPFFPKSSVEALEQLLKRLARWYSKQEDPANAPFDGGVTILQGDYNFVLYPKVRAKRKNLYNVYASQMFGKSYIAHVLFEKGASDDINVHASIYNKHLHIVLENPYCHKEYDFDLDNFVTGNYYKAMFVNHSSGIAVRRTNEQGVFKVSTSRFNLTPDHANEYVITFFDSRKRVHYHFDLFGNRLSTSLGPVQSKIQGRLRKAKAIAENMQRFDAFACSLKVADELKQRWVQDPVKFSDRFGLRYVISGSVDVKCTKGVARAYHHKNIPNKSGILEDHITNGFIVAESYKKPTIRMQFAGNYVALYDFEDTDVLINAHKYAEPIHFQTSRTIDDSKLGVVSVHTCSSPNYMRRRIGNTSVRYEMKDVMKKYGQQIGRSDESPKALYDTIQSIGSLVNTVTGTFEVLIKGKDGCFTTLMMDGHTKST